LKNYIFSKEFQISPFGLPLFENLLKTNTCHHHMAFTFDMNVPNGSSLGLGFAIFDLN
jgi:hypothetical protein